MRILLVEDEPALRSAVLDCLRQGGYVCEVAPSYEAAHEKIKLYQYDCVLVDLTLPDGNGLDLVRTLRADGSAAGILIISARDALTDRLDGLELGADDYLTKPFHLSELSTRLKALLRRRQFQAQHHLVFRDLIVWPDKTQVMVRGEELTLTRKEYDLLLYLLANPSRVLTKEAIAAHLGDDNSNATYSLSFLYTHFKNLRKKLSEKGADDYIQTVYGQGYRLRAAS